MTVQYFALAINKELENKIVLHDIIPVHRKRKHQCIFDSSPMLYCSFICRDITRILTIKLQDTLISFD